MTPDERPLEEDDVDARVRAGELAKPPRWGKAPVRVEVVEALRARLAAPRRGPRGTPHTGRRD
jgi:hypothetical protein